jgi:RNA-binding protein
MSNASAAPSPAKPTPAPKLTGKATRHLRGLGHDLTPVLSIGKNGITEGLVAETGRALLTHELIKVKVQSEAPLDRKEAAEELAEACGAALAQVLGRTFLLYKPHPKKPKIVLPVEAKKGKKGPAVAAKAPARKAHEPAAFAGLEDDGDDDAGVTDETFGDEDGDVDDEG